MSQHLALAAVVVHDYDEAIAFYTQILGFDLVEDTFLPDEQKRWVVVSPPGARESRLLLARAHLRLDAAALAQKALQPAADEHPEYADVRNLMGEIFRALGDLDKARGEFEASLEINPRYEQAQKNLDALGGDQA